MTIMSAIDKQLRNSPQGTGYNINSAVVIQIAESCSAMRRRLLEVFPSETTYVDEAAVSIIAKQRVS